MKLRVEKTIDNETGHGVFVVVDTTPPGGNPTSMLDNNDGTASKYHVSSGGTGRSRRDAEYDRVCEGPSRTLGLV